MRRVDVVPYCNEWPDRFAEEAAEIRQLQLQGFRNLYHIGSTSVPGLAAKPILDLLMEVESLKELDEQAHKLAFIGYEAFGENGIAGRRYFQKGGEERSHQIHAFATGDPGLERHLAFREYLRAYPDVRAAYASLKKQVAAECEHDIERYCDGKNAFIQHHEALALAWWTGELPEDQESESA